ncbi:MAG: tRNA lysidine(34) synthetase TilS [Chloroflexi bacterium]|nr:tRNA lysidine(34) synthetase TilS [Chloroflexota bacterium]
MTPETTPADSDHVLYVINALEAALDEAEVDRKRSLLVAVSGGADSMTALDALQTIGERSGPEIIVCHFNHQMRGADSDADEEYVRSNAEARGLAYVSEGADVAEYAREHHLAVEDAARRLRYGFLGRAAEKEGAQGAATGHTLDDQAETVLLHIARGSGLNGVRGMRLVSRTPQRWGGGQLKVIRPLLRLRRDDTEQYCRERGIIPRMDVSNESTTFTRNRLRLNVMPELEAINPRVVESIARLADTASEELAALDEVIDGLWVRVLDHADPAKRTVTLHRHHLLATPPALRRSLLRRAYSKAAGSVTNLVRTHVMDMDRLVGAGAGRSIDLPDGMRFETRVDTVVLAPSGRDDAPYPEPFDFLKLSVPGHIEFPSGQRFEMELVDRPDDLDTGSEMSEYADASAVGDTVTLRNRRDGDRFQPLGMDTAARVQDLFVNAGVPRSWRDRVPVVESESGRGIAWVAGLRIAEWARVTPETEQVLRIRLINVTDD